MTERKIGDSLRGEKPFNVKEDNELDGVNNLPALPAPNSALTD